MIEVILAGGWLMLPILSCSVVAVAICVERYWSLRQDLVAPPELLTLTLAQMQQVLGDPESREQLRNHSPLGAVLGALAQTDADQIERVREAALASVAHDLETYLTALGIIALISPLLGILGTVVGMIDVFTSVVSASGETAALAGGISTALITTAAGLSIAIPTLIAHRLLLRKVDTLLVVLDETSQRWLTQLNAEHED
ncbi:MAG TPA: biopolymer transporter ExbB [Gammaproteobacteria bacterium]|nr:biopolymer transporter ExbB [Gammaproteobacteria bacterium]